jgi:RNA polymerase sigma factor (sigma-70 family)
VVQDAIVDEARSRISELYREQGPKLWRALFSFSGDSEVASDAMAEAFARGLRDAGEIRDPAPWVWRVAFRLATAELKRRHDTAPFEESSYEMPEPVPELMAALRRLSPNQRLSVILHDYADRPSAEVADVIGCSRATVHVHLSQGRRRLRQLLEETDS